MGSGGMGLGSGPCPYNRLGSNISFQSYNEGPLVYHGLLYAIFNKVIHRHMLVSCRTVS